MKYREINEASQEFVSTIYATRLDALIGHMKEKIDTFEIISKTELEESKFKFITRWFIRRRRDKLVKELKELEKELNE